MDPQGSPPSPRSRASMLGSAFAVVKNYFTPERNPRPTEGLGITPLAREFASLTLDDSTPDTTDSFKTLHSPTDESYVSTCSFDGLDRSHIAVETDYSEKDGNLTVIVEETLINESTASCDANETNSVHQPGIIIKTHGEKRSQDIAEFVSPKKAKLNDDVCVLDLSCAPVDENNGLGIPSITVSCATPLEVDLEDLIEVFTTSRDEISEENSSGKGDETEEPFEQFLLEGDEVPGLTDKDSGGINSDSPISSESKADTHVLEELIIEDAATELKREAGVDQQSESSQQTKPECDEGLINPGASFVGNNSEFFNVSLPERGIEVISEAPDSQSKPSVEIFNRNEITTEESHKNFSAGGGNVELPHLEPELAYSTVMPTSISGVLAPDMTVDNSSATQEIPAKQSSFNAEEYQATDLEEPKEIFNETIPSSIMPEITPVVFRKETGPVAVDTERLITSFASVVFAESRIESEDITRTQEISSATPEIIAVVPEEQTSSISEAFETKSVLEEPKEIFNVTIPSSIMPKATPEETGYFSAATEELVTPFAPAVFGESKIEPETVIITQETYSAAPECVAVVPEEQASSIVDAFELKSVLEEPKEILNETIPFSIMPEITPVVFREKTGPVAVDTEGLITSFPPVVFAESRIESEDITRTQEISSATPEIIAVVPEEQTSSISEAFETAIVLKETKEIFNVTTSSSIHPEFTPTVFEESQVEPEINDSATISEIAPINLTEHIDSIPVATETLISTVLEESENIKRTHENTSITPDIAQLILTEETDSISAEINSTLFEQSRNEPEILKVKNGNPISKVATLGPEDQSQSIAVATEILSTLIVSTVSEESKIKTEMSNLNSDSVTTPGATALVSEQQPSSITEPIITTFAPTVLEKSKIEPEIISSTREGTSTPPGITPVVSTDQSECITVTTETPSISPIKTVDNHSSEPIRLGLSMENDATDTEKTGSGIIQPTEHLSTTPKAENSVFEETKHTVAIPEPLATAAPESPDEPEIDEINSEASISEKVASISLDCTQNLSSPCDESNASLEAENQADLSQTNDAWIVYEDGAPDPYDIKINSILARDFTESCDLAPKELISENDEEGEQPTNDPPRPLDVMNVLTPIQEVFEGSYESTFSVSPNQLIITSLPPKPEPDSKKDTNPSLESPLSELLAKGKFMVESTPQLPGISKRITNNNISDVSPIITCLAEEQSQSDSPLASFLDRGMLQSTPETTYEKAGDVNVTQTIGSQVGSDSFCAKSFNLNETKILPRSCLDETKILNQLDQTHVIPKTPAVNANTTITLEPNLDHTVVLAKAVENANMNVTRSFINDGVEIAAVSPFSCKNIRSKKANDEALLKNDLSDDSQENWNISFVNKNKNPGSSVLKEICDNVLDNSMGAWLSTIGKSPDKMTDNIVKNEMFTNLSNFSIFNNANLQHQPGNPINRESFFIKFDPCYQPKNLIDPVKPNETLGNNTGVLDLIGLEISTQSNEEKLQNEIERLKKLYEEREQETQDKLNEIQLKSDSLEKEYFETKSDLDQIEERNRKLQGQLQSLGTSNVNLAFISQEYQKTVKSLQSDLAERRQMEIPDATALAAERNSYQQHLNSAEAAFIDVLAKYKKMCSSVADFKKSVAQREKETAELRREATRLDELIRVTESTIKTSLEEVNRAARTDDEQFNADVSRITAQLRKAELSLKHSQDRYDKTVADNEKIAALCDDIIAGRS